MENRMSVFTGWCNLVARLGGLFARSHRDDYPPDDILSA
jgi:hypothetical protein